MSENNREHGLQELPKNLLSKIKSSKVREAKLLINQIADVQYTDEVGCTSLHYAAVGGHIDLIPDLIARGGNVKQTDVNGETPVHKAARKGNTEVIMALCSYGADIGTLNMLGQSALELAVINKDINLVKLLLMLGAEPALQDWHWASEDQLSTTERSILDLFIELRSRFNGYKDGGISVEVKHVIPGQEFKLSSLDITVTTKGVVHDFYLYCCKVQSQYYRMESKHGHVYDQLQQNQYLFSDMYEVIAWGKSPKSLYLCITVSGVPSCSESLSILPIEGTVLGNIVPHKISDSNDPDDMQYTTVNAEVQLEQSRTVRFVIITTETPEIYTITEDAMVIQPEMEPGSEIDIPKGTFDGHSQLTINVCETKSLNADEPDITEPLLITNVLDLTMDNGQQPKKAIKLKIPVHTTTDKEFVLFSCHKEYPEGDEDWEISEISSQHTGKLISFDVTQFSFYVAGSRNYQEKAKRVATQAINKERTVQLFVMMKCLNETNATLVFECILTRQGKKRRKHWKKEGFEPVESFEHSVHVYQKFRIMVSENLHVQANDQERIIIFDPNKKRNYITYNLVDKSPTGELIVEKIVEKTKNPSAKLVLKPTKNENTTFWLKKVCCQENSVQPSIIPPDEQTLQSEYEFLVKFSVAPKLEEDTVPKEVEEEKLDPNDPECPNKLSVLRWSSLKRLGEQLTDTECFHLGVQLHIDMNKLKDLQKQNNFKEKMFREWRPKRPYESLVENLKQGLDRINKQIEANWVQEAYNNAGEFRYKVPEM